MSVGGLPRCVALMVVLAWMLWPYAPRGRALLPVSSRVPRAGRKTGAGDAVRNGRVMGLSGVIAHMSSSVRAGGMISDVLADVDGSGFAGVPLTASRLKRLLMRQRMPGESAAQAEHVAFELAVIISSQRISATYRELLTVWKSINRCSAAYPSRQDMSVDEFPVSRT